MVFEIGDASRAEEILRRKLEAGERLMGFGHRVYKVRDPRADVLAKAAERLFTRGGDMHTEALHVVERFRKLENGNLQYDVTVEDPNVWETPWAIPARTFAFRPEFEFVSEFVCESTVDYQRLFKK